MYLALLQSKAAIIVCHELIIKDLSGMVNDDINDVTAGDRWLNIEAQ